MHQNASDKGQNVEFRRAGAYLSSPYKANNFAVAAGVRVAFSNSADIGICYCQGHSSRYKIIQQRCGFD